MTHYQETPGYGTEKITPEEYKYLLDTCARGDMIVQDGVEKTPLYYPYYIEGEEPDTYVWTVND